MAIRPADQKSSLNLYNQQLLSKQTACAGNFHGSHSHDKNYFEYVGIKGFQERGSVKGFWVGIQIISPSTLHI